MVDVIILGIISICIILTVWKMYSDKKKGKTGCGCSCSSCSSACACSKQNKKKE